MRNLVLILLAFIAVVTFIRALDNSEAGTMRGMAEPFVEFNMTNMNN
jgi:hypothetical protein